MEQRGAWLGGNGGRGWKETKIAIEVRRKSSGRGPEYRPPACMDGRAGTAAWPRGRHYRVQFQVPNFETVFRRGATCKNGPGTSAWRALLYTAMQMFGFNGVYHRLGALPPDPRRGEIPRTPPLVKRV